MNGLGRLLLVLCGLCCASLWAANASAEDYRLQSGDTLEISVDLDPSLKGQYVVGPDGEVTMPLAGHVEARGLTLQEVEASLEQHLKPNFKTEPQVTAALIGSQAGSLAPTIFLAGDVSKPGEYPFRSGMTVLHALSMAGGPYRPLNALAQIDPALAADSSLTLQRRLAATLLRSARLNAELTNRGSMEQPAEVAGLMSDPVITHAARQEELLFEARRSVRQREVDARRREQHALEGQISALKAQLELNNTQKTLALQEQASGKSLIDKGLSPAMKGLAMERSIAEIDAGRVQIESDLATAERSLEGAKADEAALEQERKVQLLADKEQTVAQIEELRRIFGQADGQVSNPNAAFGLKSGSQGIDSTLRYTVIRQKGGVLTEMEISELAFLEPGDLIRVVARYPASAGTVEQLAKEDGNGGTLAVTPQGTAPSN